MPNKYWRNQTDPNHGHPSVKEPGGKAGGVSAPTKTANWPGVGGKTQGKDRSAGQPKTGHKGPFHIKAEGL